MAIIETKAVEGGVQVRRTDNSPMARMLGQAGERTMKFEGVEQSKLVAGIDRWANGELIQNALPDLDAEYREFLMTGITPEEWNKMFPEE